MQQQEKSQKEDRQKRRSHRRERARREKIKVREEVEKVAKHCVFPMFCGSPRSKSRLAKLKQRDVEKVHAVVARGISRSKC